MNRNIWDGFIWHRARDGYEWHDVGCLRLLVPKRVASRTVPTVAYSPMQGHRTLFQDFAALASADPESVRPDPDAVLDFANRYGQLGYPVKTMVPVDFSPTWEYLDDLDFEEMKELPLVAVEPDDDRPGQTDGDETWVAGEFLDFRGHDWQRRQTWFAQIRNVSRVLRGRGGVEHNPGRRRDLQRFVNAELRETVGAFVLWSSGVPSRGEQRSSREREGFCLGLRPHSLIGAIWLQAAIWLSFPLTHRECLACGDPIEISRSPGGTRTDALFCSAKCKVKDFRKRRSEARRLAKTGRLTPEQIAKRVRSDGRTIRRWIRGN